MRIRFVTTLLFTLFSGVQAWACSCGQTRSMSQILEDGAIVILASPVGTEVPDSWNNYIFPTRLRVWETYAGATSIYESVETRPGSSCAMPIPSNQTSLMVVYREKTGLLGTSICADGGFSEDQWMIYFESGKETPPRDMCYMQIKQAYDAEFLMGEPFELERPECAVHIPDYDRKYKRAR